jgi:hypothetical protein
MWLGSAIEKAEPLATVRIVTSFRGACSFNDAGKGRRNLRTP